MVHLQYSILVTKETYDKVLYLANLNLCSPAKFISILVETHIKEIVGEVGG